MFSVDTFELTHLLTSDDNKITTEEILRTGNGCKRVHTVNTSNIHTFRILTEPFLCLP